ncbi:hypothetical protein QQX98_010999 [Neonectria punicea]|uniref:PQ loop repeat protein n=1 Tax=Neonectria punicea TaxID=979145 RepID=A0ABR1GMV4_9HYPO
MSWIATITGYVAPFFIVLSPIISYSDQVLSMHRNKSSAGFSLDIPLIMLIASFLRIFYWPHAQYDTSLLLQSLLMLVVQMVLLKVALDHRPPPSTKGGEAAVPFAGAGTDDSAFGFQRPYNFWQWRSPKRYWQTIMYFASTLLVLELVLSRMPALYATYSDTIGYIGLAVEATLPLPQILVNLRSRSCKGLRLSVLASWVGGDSMKLIWFFTATTEIPWSFKISGMFQASCDFFLGAQYLVYGAETPTVVKEHAMADWSTQPVARAASRSPTRRSGVFDKEVE